MSHPKTPREQMVSLLETLTTAEGMRPSTLSGVHLLRVNESLARAPVVYDPSIVILAQGSKTGYLGDQIYTYDANNYLVLSVPLPFDCETHASPGKPLLGVALTVDPSTLAELLLEMDDDAIPTPPAPAIYSTPLTKELTGATVRLLESLRSPLETRVLGPQIVREITYRVLRGEQSAALRAICTRHSHFAQIGKVLRRIHDEYSVALDVDTLAREASMSVSTFHHNFRAVTSTSPLQYIKSIRLHRARLLMIREGLNAGVAARRVGYESSSQFSREFKRFFGETPAEGAAKVRALFG